MKDNTMIRKTFNFGKIAYYGKRRIYTAKVELELRKETSGLELSICGGIYTQHGNMISGGQNLDTMKKYLGGNASFRRLFKLWEGYHLNGLNAGTARQTAALKEAGITEYRAACDYLKSIGLYVDSLADNERLSVETERANRKHYEYGYGWIMRDLPADVLDEIYNLCGVERTDGGDDYRKAA